ncbi:hypothetical protein EJ07DRAFT_148650 [Lizonia empirigonia]|nr:hypothetical protein EJ07DRAFT_148650 [Lizonia empirigonia]
MSASSYHTKQNSVSVGLFTTNRERELGLDRRETGYTEEPRFSDNWFLRLSDQALPRSYHLLDYWLNASKSESMPERGDFRLHQSDTNRPLAQNLTRSALVASLKLGSLAGVLQLYSAQD